MRYLVNFVWANNWHHRMPIIERMQNQHSSGVLKNEVVPWDDNYWKNANNNQHSSGVLKNEVVP